MALNVAAAMDGIGTRLGTISGLRVYDYASDRVSPPAAIVGWPETIEFDQTYVRGADMATFPVAVIVGRVSDRASRDVLTAYVPLVKAALDGTLGGAVASARVTSADINPITVAGVDYVAATFMLEAYG